MKSPHSAASAMVRTVIVRKKWYMADTLEEDVARRDFTVNGMAMTAQGEVIDLVGGLKDIKSLTLRTIGNAEERFQEDALRLFRACRFVGKLGFCRITAYWMVWRLTLNA